MKEYQTITKVSGPLVLAEVDEPIGYDEIAEIEAPQDETKRGQVLESLKGLVVTQVFEDTGGIDRNVSVRFLDETLKMPVTEDLLRRVLDGSGQPIDGGPEIASSERRDIVGVAINPCFHECPEELIRAGASAIDGMNTLAHGQKLPIFSTSGLPHNDLALQIVRQVTMPEDEESDEESEFAVVLGTMDITQEEASEFMRNFECTGALKCSVVFTSPANDPTVEQTIMPRLALTTAEHPALNKDCHVLAILIDVTNYCGALRGTGAAREEVPGRRGYLSYMYTDPAQLCEHADRIQDRGGSVTQIPILTMPGDDDIHPVLDLTGYTTEGQIYTDRGLSSQDIRPPTNPLPSLSRLMNDGAGEGLTREDHADVPDQVYMACTEGEDLRDLTNIVGHEVLSERDSKYFDFAERFEAELINQGFDTDRSIEDILDIGWDLLLILPKSEPNRIDEELIENYYEGDAKSIEAEAQTVANAPFIPRFDSPLLFVPLASRVARPRVARENFLTPRPRRLRMDAASSPTCALVVVGPAVDRERFVDILLPLSVSTAPSVDAASRRAEAKSVDRVMFEADHLAHTNTVHGVLVALLVVVVPPDGSLLAATARDTGTASVVPVADSNLSERLPERVESVVAWRRHGAMAASKITEDLKERAIDEAPVGITVADCSLPDRPLVYVNEAFETMTDYSADATLGRNCRYLQGLNIDPEWAAELHRVIETEEPASVELLNYRTNDETF